MTPLPPPAGYRPSSISSNDTDNELLSSIHVLVHCGPPCLLPGCCAQPPTCPGRPPPLAAPFCRRLARRGAFGRVPCTQRTSPTTRARMGGHQLTRACACHATHSVYPVRLIVLSYLKHPFASLLNIFILPERRIPPHILLDVRDWNGCITEHPLSVAATIWPAVSLCVTFAYTSWQRVHARARA